MSSTELGVSLGIGIPLLVGVIALLRYAYRQRFVPRRQSDPEIGRERSAYAYARSQYRLPSTSSHVSSSRRRDTVEDSRRPSNGADAAQRSGQPQTQPARSSLTRGTVRIRSHPVTGLSGRELRAMDRRRLSTLSQPPSSVVEKDNRHGSASAPASPLVADGRSTVAGTSDNSPRLARDTVEADVQPSLVPMPEVGCIDSMQADTIAPACPQSNGDRTSGNRRPSSSTSTNQESDPRVSPIGPSTPASSRSHSTPRNSGNTNANVITPILPADDDVQDRHLHLRRSFESIPDDIDDMMSGRHKIPADGTSPQSPRDLPHTTRRQRATDSSNRGGSQSGPQPRRERNVTFNDNQNITYTIPLAASDSTSSVNAASSSQNDDGRPTHLPGTGLESPTVSPPLSENGIRLENITARNTAANRVRRSA